MEEELLLKRRYKYRIEPQTVDFQFKVTPASLVDLLLTTSGRNADDNGFGIRRLNKMDCSWVLSRLAFEMKRFPGQYEYIEVETWVAEVSRASTVRNFTIYDKNDEIIGSACSVWVMINVETRRPMDLDLLDGIHRFANGDMGSIEPPIRLRALNSNVSETFKAKYADIDVNHHVNTCKYVEWVSNCFDLDTYKSKKIKRFEINFVNEILFGDIVEIIKDDSSIDDIRVEIRKNQKTASLARVVF